MRGKRIAQVVVWATRYMCKQIDCTCNRNAGRLLIF